MTPSFFMQTFRDDATTLHAGWLPETPARLLMGFTAPGLLGDGVLLSTQDAAALLRALRAGKSARLQSGVNSSVTLRLLHTNRGEPYREGVEISIEAGERDIHSVFLERGVIETLAQLLKFRLSAEEIEQAEGACR